MNALSIVFIVLPAIVAVPVVTLLTEILAALTVRHPDPAEEPAQGYGPVAILVPAHDESRGIRATLENAKRQLRPIDRLMVVADNCSDYTATIAAAAGAEVVVRSDPSRIGKGFALDFGVRRLAADPPDVVVILDADCRMDASALTWLASTCATSRRPVQGLNLMVAPPGSVQDYRIATFAFRVKNWVRPLGSRKLGLPCTLTGTGMAMPWEVLADADLANASIVEDMKLSLELTSAGRPPLFCPAARIISTFPPSRTGAASQRRRWEQGHLGLLTRLAPRMALKAIARGDIMMLAAALDAATPPVTLLGMTLALTVALTALAALCGLSSAGLMIALAASLGYFVALGLAWWRFGRDLFSLAAVPSLLSYTVDKLSLYRLIFSARDEIRWLRAEREDD